MARKVRPFADGYYAPPGGEIGATARLLLEKTAAAMCGNAA